MIRNPTVLRVMGISPKTATLISAGKGQDRQGRQNYRKLGIDLISSRTIKNRNTF